MNLKKTDEEKWGKGGVGRDMAKEKEMNSIKLKNKMAGFHLRIYQRQKGEQRERIMCTQMMKRARHSITRKE